MLMFLRKLNLMSKEIIGKDWLARARTDVLPKSRDILLGTFCVRAIVSV